MNRALTNNTEINGNRARVGLRPRMIENNNGIAIKQNINETNLIISNQNNGLTPNDYFDLAAKCPIAVILGVTIATLSWRDIVRC